MVAQAHANNPDLKVCALGGEQLAGAGAQLLFDLTASSVVGLFEVVRHYGFFKSLFEKTVAWIAEHKPRIVCYVDYPGFNLRMAKRLMEEGIARKAGGSVTQLYYISPQIWAWKAGRRFKMAEMLDSLAVIFPFEVDCYKDTSLPVRFVGHPFVEESYQLPVSYDADAPILLLPGSRRAAVGRIAPVMFDGFASYLKDHPDSRAMVLYPNDAIRAVIADALTDRSELKDKVTLARTADLTPVKASMVLTSSGTMSLNVALAGIPGAIVYRAHPLTYLFGRMVVKIPYLGIANLLLKRPAWREFIQGAASPEALAEHLLESSGYVAREQAQEAAVELRKMLGEAAAITPGDWLVNQLAESPQG